MIGRRGTRWRRAITAALATWAWTGGVASAEEPTKHTLDEAIHAAPDACIDPAILARDVAGWLKRNRIDARVHVDVAREARGYGFVIRRAQSVVGERHLAFGPLPCSEKRAALALAVATALDATLLRAMPIEEIAPDLQSVAPEDAAAQPPAKPVPMPRRPKDPLQAASPAFSLQGSLSADAFVLVGVFDRAAVGARSSLGIAFSGRLEARVHLLAVPAVVTDLGRGEVRTALRGGGADVCWGTLPAWLRLRGCAGILGGAISIRGEGYQPSYPASVTHWMAATAGVDTEFVVASPLAIIVGASAFVPITQARLRVDNTSEARRDPGVGGVVSIGVMSRVW